MMRKFITICLILILTITPVFREITIIIHANDGGLTASVKESACFVINQKINKDNFLIKIGNDVISRENFSIEPEIFNTTGVHKIAIRYSHNDIIHSAVLDIPVVERNIIGLRAELRNQNIIFVENKTVTKTDVILTGIFNDGLEETLADYEIKNPLISAGQNEIIISCLGLETCISIIGEKKKIDRIEAACIYDSVLTDHEFIKKEISVKVIYNDGSQEIIEDFSISPYKLENGVYSNIKVTYGDYFTTFRIMGKKEDTLSPTMTPKPITTPRPTITPKKTVTFKLHSTLRSITQNNSTKESYKIFTNKKITFTLTTKNIKKITYQLVAKGRKLNEKSLKNVTKNKICISKTTKPSVLYIRYMDANGDSKTVKTKGFIIDNKAPTINGIKNGVSYQNKVTIEYKDALSGIKSATLNGKSIVNNTVVTVPGKYILLVTDKAGNKKKVTFNISKPIIIPKPTQKPIITQKPVKTKKPITTKPTVVPVQQTPKPTQKPIKTPKPTTKSKKVKSIKFLVSNIKLKVGQSKKLKVTVLPTNAKNKKVTWKSTQPFVATVTQDGKVVGCGKGRTTIIAISKENGKIKKSCTVLVK